MEGGDSYLKSVLNRSRHETNQLKPSKRELNKLGENPASSTRVGRNRERSSTSQAAEHYFRRSSQIKRAKRFLMNERKPKAMDGKFESFFDRFAFLTVGEVLVPVGIRQQTQRIYVSPSLKDIRLILYKLYFIKPPQE